MRYLVSMRCWASVLGALSATKIAYAVGLELDVSGTTKRTCILHMAASANVNRCLDGNEVMDLGLNAAV